MALSAVAGLTAGALAWAAGETRAVDSGPVEKHARFMGVGIMVPEITHEARLEGVRQTSTKAFGILGGLTGLLLGLVGGVVAGSGRRAAMAGGVGLVVGGLVGAVVPWATLPLFEHWRAPDPGAMLPALVMHGAFWIPIGAAGGLALGLGLRDRMVSGLAGGVLGAVLATVAFEMLGGLFFPMAETGEPISGTSITRLLGRLLVATLAAVGAGLAIAPRASTAEPVKV